MEINLTEIILAIIAIAATIITHKLDKKKFKAEVSQIKAQTETNNIENMDKSLDFYEKLAEATNKRLDDVLARQDVMIKENETLKSQVSEVNSRMTQLAKIICTNLTCVHREVDEEIINCVYPNGNKEITKIVKKTKKV